MLLTFKMESPVLSCRAVTTCGIAPRHLCHWEDCKHMLVLDCWAETTSCHAWKIWYMKKGTCQYMSNGKNENQCLRVKWNLAPVLDCRAVTTMFWIAPRHHRDMIVLLYWLVNGDFYKGWKYSPHKWIVYTLILINQWGFWMLLTYNMESPVLSCRAVTTMCGIAPRHHCHWVIANICWSWTFELKPPAATHEKFGTWKTRHVNTCQMGKMRTGVCV